MKLIKEQLAMTYGFFSPSCSNVFGLETYYNSSGEPVNVTHTSRDANYLHHRYNDLVRVGEIFVTRRVRHQVAA